MSVCGSATCSGAVEQRLIHSNIVCRHAGSGEAIFKSLPHARAVKRRHSAERLDRVGDGLNDMAGNAFIDDLAHPAVVEGNNGGTAGHRFNDDEPERLRPVNGKQPGQCVAKEPLLSHLVDLAEELDAWRLEELRYRAVKIRLIETINLGRYLERQVRSVSNCHGTLDALLR